MSGKETELDPDTSIEEMLCILEDDQETEPLAKSIGKLYRDIQMGTESEKDASIALGELLYGVLSFVERGVIHDKICITRSALTKYVHDQDGNVYPIMSTYSADAERARIRDRVISLLFPKGHRGAETLIHFEKIAESLAALTHIDELELNLYTTSIPHVLLAQVIDACTAEVAEYLLFDAIPEVDDILEGQIERPWNFRSFAQPLPSEALRN